MIGCSLTIIYGSFASSIYNLPFGSSFQSSNSSILSSRRGYLLSNASTFTLMGGIFFFNSSISSSSMGRFSNSVTLSSRRSTFIFVVAYCSAMNSKADLSVSKEYYILKLYYSLNKLFKSKGKSIFILIVSGLNP